MHSRSRIHLASRGLVAVLAGLAVSATPAAAADLWVDRESTACSDASTSAPPPTKPFCTISRAAALAKAGDTVRVNGGRYVETVRPAASGTTAAPIRYVAEEPGVVVDAAGAANALKIIALSNLVFEGMSVTGGVNQGVWLDNASAIVLSKLSISANKGAGVQIKASTGVEVRDSAIDHNGGAGIFEVAGTTGARYVHNTVDANGINGSLYNGDGIQLGGSGAYVADNTITGNGDPGPYEHGIYAASVASDYVIEDNVFSNNAAAGVKAAGAGKAVR